MTEKVQVLSSTEGCPPLAIIEEAGEATAIVWPGVGAKHRSMHKISLATGGRTIRMEHPGEAVYYVVEGSVTVSDDSGDYLATKGAMVFVEPSTSYILAAGDGRAQLIGGPCPPDPALYEGMEYGR